MRLTFLLLALVVGACGQEAPPSPSTTVAPSASAPQEASGAVDPGYMANLEEEWKQREASLVSESGWLTLVALSWLEEGESTIGSGEGSVVALPEWSAPARLGALRRQGTRVVLEPAPEAGLMHEGAPVHAALELLADTAEGGPTRVTREGLTFYVIERQGKIGVRAKDTRHPDRTHFAGIPRFPASESWRVEARFEPFTEPRKVRFPTAIGTTDEATVPGEVVFEVDGEELRLLPFQDEPSDPLFFVFADKTSGIETYGGGRFLGAEAPVDGRVVIDFNTATNPPCAFTPFATCPLPPAENRLAVRVEAGEKVPAGH